MDEIGDSYSQIFIERFDLGVLKSKDWPTKILFQLLTLKTYKIMIFANLEFGEKNSLNLEF